MSEATKIEWCDATVNIWQGCEKIAPGCKNCYAERDVGRWGFDVWGKLKPRLYCKDWEAKLRALNRKAHRLGRRLRVFINSESDFFEDHRGAVINRAEKPQRLYIKDTDDGWEPTTEEKLDVYPFGNAPLDIGSLRRRAFQLFDRLTMLDILLVTKRPENVERMWNTRNGELAAEVSVWSHRSNVWLGYSASDMASLQDKIEAVHRLRDLVPVLFLSLEPLLAPIDFGKIVIGRDSGFAVRDVFWCDLAERQLVDWVIVGGESGKDARPCDVAWIRSIVAQCAKGEAACFVKQLGSRATVTVGGQQTPTGTRTFEAGPFWKVRHKKGGNPAEWSEDLRVREFPRVAAAEVSHA